MIGNRERPKVKPAYLPLENAARWAGMSSELLRRMACRGMIGILRPNGSEGVALVRLAELRHALERTRWPVTTDTAPADASKVVSV